MTATADHATGLDLAPAGRWDRRVALFVVLLSALVLTVVVPIAGQQWGAAPAFIPAYQAAVAVNDLVTAALLLASFREARRPSLGLLGGAYLYTAVLVAAHTLSFPGLFGAGSLIGGPQSTVWLWLAWHVALPVVVIAHALRRDAGSVALSGRTPTTVQGMVLAAVTFAGGAVALATLGHDSLPALLEGNRYIPGVTQPALALPLVLSLAALAALIVRTRLRRALDLWLAVTMGAWAVEILLSAVLNSGRFQAGFYVGRLYGLIASGTVLISLLLATAALHSRLARALAGERDAVRIALNRSEARYRLMVESARGIAIVTLDADGIITGWNAGAEAMMGHTEAEALGQPGAMFFTPEDRITGAPEAEMQGAREMGRAENERWHLRRDGSRFWGSGLVMPLADRTGYVKVFRDRTAEHDAIERMREGEGRLLALVQASAQVFWTTDVAGRVVEDSPSWRAYTGQETTEWLELGWLDAVHPDDRQHTVGAWHRSTAVGEAYEVEYRLFHAASGAHRWTLARAVPLRGADGRLRGWVGMNTDIHDRRVAEERQALLAREVDHRAKNVLAVVQSVLRLTRAPDIRAYREAAEGRVAALARAHTLLARDSWAGAGLRAILAEELAPYIMMEANAGSVAVRAEMEGPEVTLSHVTAQPLAMALHELATNAAKHGALSTPGGRLRVSWRRAPNGDLLLRWEERGGPGVKGPPARRGFGSSVLEATLRQQLGGAIRLDWSPEGLGCEMTVPAARLVSVGRPAADQSSRAGAGAVSRPSDVQRDLATGRAPTTVTRVLVVEDEALVALDLAATLSALGCEVIGPATTTAEALRLAAAEPPPDAAVLDLNLGGESSLPVADALAARGVPVVFATGYGGLPAEAGHHAGAEFLQKPIAVADLGNALGRLLSRTEAAE